MLQQSSESKAPRAPSHRGISIKFSCGGKSSSFQNPWLFWRLAWNPVQPKLALNLRRPCLSLPGAAIAHVHCLAPNPVFWSRNSNNCSNVSSPKTQCRFPILRNRGVKSYLIVAVQEGSVWEMGVQTISHTHEINAFLTSAGQVSPQQRLLWPRAVNAELHCPFPLAESVWKLNIISTLSTEDQT